MLIGSMRVSSNDERQVVDLQLDALLAAGINSATCIRTNSQVGATTAPA